MRHYDRVQCLAILDYNAGGIAIGARCMKDARHGHGTKRQGFLFHRVDVTLPDGRKVKLTWDGKGEMSPEMERERTEKKTRPPHVMGADGWNGP